MIKTIPFILMLAPTIIEVFFDRNGEGRTDKTRDAIVAVIMYAAVALVNWWWLDVHPLRSLALTFGFRVILFDYAITWVLRRNGVINNNAKIFSYLGKTSRIDTNRLWIMIGAWGRFIVRIIILCASSFVYFALQI